MNTSAHKHLDMRMQHQPHDARLPWRRPRASFPNGSRADGRAKRPSGRAPSTRQCATSKCRQQCEMQAAHVLSAVGLLRTVAGSAVLRDSGPDRDLVPPSKGQGLGVVVWGSQIAMIDPTGALTACAKLFYYILDMYLWQGCCDRDAGPRCWSGQKSAEA